MGPEGRQVQHANPEHMSVPSSARQCRSSRKHERCAALWLEAPTPPTASSLRPLSGADSASFDCACSLAGS